MAGQKQFKYGAWVQTGPKHKELVEIEASSVDAAHAAANALCAIKGWRIIAVEDLILMRELLRGRALRERG